MNKLDVVPGKKTARSPLAIDLLNMDVNSLQGPDEAHPSMSLTLLSGNVAQMFQGVVASALKKPIDQSTVLLVKKPSNDQSPGYQALLNGIQCDDNHHIVRGPNEIYLLNLNQSCHYLLNIFHALSHPKGASLHFSVKDLNTLYAFLSNFVMQAISLRASRDMRIVIKIKVLLGLANVDCGIVDIMNTFAKEGAQRILSNVKLDPNSNELKDVFNFSQRWVDPGSAYSDKRYETRTITTVIKHNKGRGHFVNEKITYELPENVCQASDHLQALSSKGSISYRDVINCMDDIQRIREVYRLKKHYVHTYHIFDLTHDLNQLQSRVAVLNPIAPEMPRMLEAIHSICGILMMRQTEDVSKDISRLLIELVRKHLDIGETDDRNEEDQAGVKPK